MRGEGRTLVGRGDDNEKERQQDRTTATEDHFLGGLVYGVRT
jgi:hypothetical protein